MPALWIVVLASFLCAFLGSLVGIGGAVLLVPALLILGVDPLLAAPLGMLLVGANSLAAASKQIDEGLVHHRLALSVQLLASVGTVGGAIVSARIDPAWLARALGASALVGAAAVFIRKGVRNHPSGIFDDEPAGEWPGTLGGSYSLDGSAVPYCAHRVPAGLGVALVSGGISGLAGVGGGFMKVPAISEIMKVPVKVAGATSLFTSGVTASTGLLVYLAQGRIEVRSGATVVLGGLLGGYTGAIRQASMKATTARQITAVLLAAIAVVVIVRTL